ASRASAPQNHTCATPRSRADCDASSDKGLACASPFLLPRPPAQGRGGALAELLLIVDREAAHMGEAVRQGDLRHPVIGRGGAQSAVHPLEPSPSQVAHWRGSAEITKLL